MSIDADFPVPEMATWAEDEASYQQPQGVIESAAKRERAGAVTGVAATNGGDGAGRTAPPSLPEWPSLLRVLLARLRGEQPFLNCFLCLTSDDPKDCCAEHLARLERIVRYPEAA